MLGVKWSITLALLIFLSSYLGDIAMAGSEQPVSDSPQSNLIKWQVIAQGGEKSSSLHYKVQQTVGQPVIGVSASPSYTLTHGYWQSFYITGDADGSGAVDISDAVFLIAYIFSGGPPPVPLSSGDADCNGSVDISDVVYVVAYIFGGGPAPCFVR